MVWGGRREEGSGWVTHVNLWWIHFDIRQNQYNIVKLKNKINLKKKNKKNTNKWKGEGAKKDFWEKKKESFYFCISTLLILRLI